MKRNLLRSIFTACRFNLVHIFSLFVPCIGVLLFFSLCPQIAKGKYLTFSSFPLLGVFQIVFFVDRLSLGFGILVSSLYFLVTVYSVSYTQTHRLKYFSLLTLNFICMLGLILSQNLLGFYIFFEMVSISTYFLIIHSGEREAFDAGFKYIVMMLLGGLLILVAIMLLFVTTVDGRDWSGWAGICFSIGCLFKAGAFPFHTWLPEAHPAAPSPISALLSGTMIKVGAYGLVRAFFYPAFLGGISQQNSVFSFESLRGVSQSLSNMNQWLVSPSLLLIFTGVLSMVIGVTLALIQKDLKKLLAYHSISQIGYILLGIGIGGYGLAGGLLHIFSHAIFKGLLFLAVGAVIFRTETRTIDQLGGLWRKMPVTTLTCVIAALSISGVPLTCGYASKGIIFEGLKENLALQIFFILTSAGTCASFLKLVRHTFFGKLNSQLSNVKEVSGLMYIPMIFIAIGSLMLGIFPAFALRFLLGSFAPKPHLWSLTNIFEALLSLGIGFALYLFLMRMGILGLNCHTDTYLKPVIPKFLGQGHILRYFSVDRFYSSIAQVILALCSKAEKPQRRSLSIYIQMMIYFLIIIIFTYLILLEK